MKRVLLVMLTLSAAAVTLHEVQAQQPRNSNGLPKVDFQVGRIQKVGMALAIPVTNGGFQRSPNTSVAVAIWDAQSRQLIMTKSLSVAALQPGQTRRVLVVPPQGKTVSVRATVDPGNRVQETNERNNVIASRH